MVVGDRCWPEGTCDGEGDAGLGWADATAAHAYPAAASFLRLLAPPGKVEVLTGVLSQGTDGYSPGEGHWARHVSR